MSIFKTVFKNNDLVVIMLIFILVLELIIAKTLINNIEELQIKVEQGNLQQSVFVVPESGNNKERPADETMLLSFFVYNVTSSFLSYNPNSFTKQAVNMAPYMSSSMFSKFNNFFFDNLINMQKRPVSIFKIDKTKTEIIAKDIYREKTGFEVKEYDIVIKGQRQFMTLNDLLKPYEDTVKLSVRKVLLTEANPYGYELTDFELQKILK